MKTETSLLPKAEAKQLHALRDRRLEISEEISNLEERRKSKAAEGQEIERRLQTIGTERLNGNLRKEVSRLVEDGHVVKAELCGIDAVLGEARAALRETMAAIAPLEAQEALANLSADLEKKDREAAALCEEWAQRRNFALFGAYRMGQIIRELRMIHARVNRLSEHPDPTVRTNAIRLHNRIGEFAEKSQYDREFLPKIESNLAAGWKPI